MALEELVMDWTVAAESKNCCPVYSSTLVDLHCVGCSGRGAIKLMGDVSFLTVVSIGELLRITLSSSEPRLRMKTPMLACAPVPWIDN